tara:strand:+ start:637 stop:858 length:222 start_codon:yes stop_codon:yes gene_type:complete
MAEEQNIELSDINLMAQIINIASQKGAFSAQDLEIIGKLYNKLDGILKKFKKEEVQVPPKEMEPITEEGEEIN